MARAKKPEEKVKEGATLTIDVDTFVRTRDSVRFLSSSLHSSLLLDEALDAILLWDPRRGRR
jgi:hypothetical protein